MDRESLLARLKATLRERNPLRAVQEFEHDSISDLCRALVSTRGEASGVALATVIIDRYEHVSDSERVQFFRDLVNDFDPDPTAVAAAAERFARDQSADSLAQLTSVVEAPRQELLRRLNHAPGATGVLVRMRADMLALLANEPDLRRLDADFQHLLRSWFNRGFLVMRPITWSSPADLLEKIIAYEAVHEIADWDELRRRLQPTDRRCFAFFHPAMPDEPLVFVQVALTRGTPDSITGVLGGRRNPLAAADADTAVFYSISNCQAGLRGVSFGSFLIKQVASDLARDLPNLNTFVTLSPAPDFRSWLESRVDAGDNDAAELLELVATEDWARDAVRRDRHAHLITGLAATYFLHAKRADGMPLDAVARFHLGNGARLERINPQANLTPTGIGRSAGMMVNYRYHLDRIEENHEAYATLREVRASDAVRRAAQNAADAACPART